MTTIPQAAAKTNIELFGFQAGPDGFVRYGLDPEPIDYLFLRVIAGRQSGKTFAGALRSFLYMNKYPGSLGMGIGLTSDKLRDTMLPTLFRVYNLMGYKYGTHFEYNKTERCLTFLTNGSQMLMRSAEEPDNLPGPSLAWFWPDEFRKMPEKVFQLLQPTLTQVGYPHQCWMTSTPAGKGHWSRKIWLPKVYAKEFNEQVFERKAGTYRSYNAHTRDNPNLSPDYYKSLLSTYGEGTALARQELFGEEVVLEDLVYPLWNSEKFICPEADWPARPKKVLAGVDFGWANPTAIAVVGVDEEGRHYLMDEFYRTGVSEKFLVEYCKSIRQRHDIEYFVCDSADPRWIQTLRHAYLPAIAAKKTVGAAEDPSSGIGLCYSQLAHDPQSFYVHPRCTSFRREIEGYVRDESNDLKNLSERPRKKADHLMDAWRYAELAIARFWANPAATRATTGSLEVRA